MINSFSPHPASLQALEPISLGSVLSAACMEEKIGWIKEKQRKFLLDQKLIYENATNQREKFFN